MKEIPFPVVGRVLLPIQVKGTCIQFPLEGKGCSCGKLPRKCEIGYLSPLSKERIEIGRSGNDLLHDLSIDGKRESAREKPQKEKIDSSYSFLHSIESRGEKKVTPSYLRSSSKGLFSQKTKRLFSPQGQVFNFFSKRLSL
jgi:hypothetical protein